MTNSRLFAGAAAAALVLAGAGSAAAQTYNRIVVFGDSLSDNGNLFAATNGTQPPSPPYFQGRFSNGPVFTELLGFTPLQRAATGPGNPVGTTGPVTGNVNYAFGGARTDTNGVVPLAMRNQLALYLARGGTFGSGDLVTVFGGANDIFQGIPVAAAGPNPVGAIQTISVTAAGNIGLITSQIAAAGAGTILVPNLPNLAFTPQFNTSPAAQLADAASVAFNGALFSQIQGVAAGTNANIIFMDVARANDFIRANPSALGFTNITQACLNAATGAVCSNPDSFLYFDGVHPTAAGHRFLAQLATDYIYYGALATPYGQVAQTSLDHRQQALDRSFDRLEGGELGPRETDVALMIDVEDSTFDADGNMPEGESRSTSIRLAADHGISERMRVGAMISVSDAEAAIGPVEFSARTLGGDVYMGWRGEGLFVNAGTGFGLDEYDDFQRVTPVGGFVHRAGRADGWSAGARVQTGVWLQAGGFALSPRVGLNALRAKTSEFQEDGPSARQRIAERAVGGLNGELALRAETSLSQGVRIHGELGYREWLTSDSEDLRVSLVDNTANELSVGSDTTEGVTLVDLGISAPAFGRVRLGATYRGRMSDGRDSHAALFSASMRY